MPTATASETARSWCTRLRLSSPVTQRDSGTTTRPSRVTADLYVTNGRRAETHVLHASFWRRASAAWSPSTSSTSTPPSRRRAKPRPSVLGFGSRAPTTTRAMPAARIASTQGGVRPWCAQGSSVTKRVPPRARSPAASRATTSACGPPARSCQPSPTTSSPATITAPTTGFGRVVPRPRSASSSARSNGFGKGLHQLPVGARVVLPAEDLASGHGELRAGAPDVGDVFLADAAVHLDEEILVQLLPELRDPL